MKTVSRSILVWFCLLVLAFVNGAFRELVMVKLLGITPPLANQISCLTGVTLWTLLLLLIWRKLEVGKFSEAVLIGMGWFVATMLFETFVINRKLTWSHILHTYDVSVGEYWGLALLWLGLMPLAAYSLDSIRRFINTWGATAEEQILHIQSEEFLRSPHIASTHALTINSEPENIWPWIVQMGQGRGGFYSYSWLENLFGCKIQNANQIIPQLQNLKLGDFIALHPKAPKLRVTVFEINRTLAFEGWIFSLKPLGKNKTRLISRIYTEQKPELGRIYNFIMKSPLFDLAHFIMSRKQLHNIKELSES